MTSMDLQTFRPPSFSGNLAYWVCKWKSCDGFGRAHFQNHLVYGKSLFRKHSRRTSTYCCYGMEKKNPSFPSKQQLLDARVIYSIAPALGHNQESHPESSARVPAIVTALENMELTSKFRGSEILELESFKPASVDDIATVHTKAYVSGLEKAMDQASQQGIIFIEGSGPTYATTSTFHESLVAAGAGLALVDSVVIS